MYLMPASSKMVSTRVWFARMLCSSPESCSHKANVDTVLLRSAGRPISTGPNAVSSRQGYRGSEASEDTLVLVCAGRG